MSIKELGEKVMVHYNGEQYSVAATADEKDVRDALVEAGFPEVANARVSKDAETGDWTVTKEAGQKG